MDAVGILEAASLLVPEGVATDNDVTVSDVWDYLAHDEWEVALDLLQELGAGWTAPTHPAPGDRITLYETAVVGGMASILEVNPPEV